MASQMKTMFVAADSGDLSQVTWDVLVSVRLELFMFLCAMACYVVLFYSRVPKDVKRLKMKSKAFQEYSESLSNKADDATPKSFENANVANASLRRALDVGDHKNVLKCWNALKQFDSQQSMNLVQVVESMQCSKKDAQFIVRELKGFLKKNPCQCDMGLVNDILESLGKRLDSQLMGLVVDMLPSLELKQDQRTYEIFLSMHATTRSSSDVQGLIAEMQAGDIEFSDNAQLAVIRAALQTGNFDEAILHFAELKTSWDGEIASWALPRHVVSQLVELACKEHRLDEFILQLKGVPLPEEAINAMLTECVRLNDAELARSVEALARQQLSTLSDSTYSLLIKGLEGRPWRMKAVVQEVLNREVAVFSADLALAVVNACSKIKEVDLVDKLLERMQPKQLNVLSAFIRSYVESEHANKACDVFEHYILPLSESESQKRIMIDSRVERMLVTAAMGCGRSSLVQCLFDSSKTDVAKYIVMIRKNASENNLRGALSIFKSLKDSGVEMNSIIYNTVIDACVKCRDLKAAEDWMRQTKEAGMVDAISFNTLMKAHLMSNNVDKARAIMSDMKKAGFQPNRVTFNELLNTTVQHSTRRSDVWQVVKEMKDASIPPSQVTCSILLKSLNSKSVDTDILLTMDLIDSINEPMDEVMLSSVVEACVRIGKPDMLARKLQDLQKKDRVVLNSSHTCGSLIKAYGHAKDLEGVWRVWKEMRSRLIKPTSITLGCMVEAVVNNGDTEAAFEILREIQQEEQNRDAVNAIIYCSVLKGFAHERKLERVWDVYKEMRERKLEMSLILFNTIVDACARSGRMDHLPTIMADMKRHYVEPNIITYSTILKGHCLAGDIQLAFSTLRKMKVETSLKPDEIMYNSLLDGCAKNNLYEEGMEVFEEMQKEGVTSSNFTLSIMVKLLTNARKVEQAFDLVRELPQKHRFKPNVHVYTNLMSACIKSRQAHRALTVLDTMVKERVQPDGRVYGVLIRAAFYGGNCQQADSLLRSALGLPGGLSTLDARMATCAFVDHNLVNETLTSLVDYGCAQSLGAPLLADIKKSKVRVNIDQATMRRTMSGVAGDPCTRSAPKGKGKGKGAGQRTAW